MANSVDPDETAPYEPCHLDQYTDARMSILVCRVERLRAFFSYGSGPSP